MRSRLLDQVRSDPAPRVGMRAGAVLLQRQADRLEGLAHLQGAIDGVRFQLQGAGGPEALPGGEARQLAGSAPASNPGERR